MKKIYLVLALAVGGSFANNAIAQTASVLLIPNAGASVAFPSITAAYAAIPASPAVSYTIEILPTYTGTDASEVYPIAFTDKGITPGSAITITVRPSAANNGEVIQRPTPASGPTVSFDGGDNVILDGRPGSITSDTTNYLRVLQPFSTTTALPAGSLFRAIDFVNNANSNTIQYVKVTSAAATNITGAQGIVVGASTTGNNNNRILNNIVSGGSRGIQDFGVAAVTTIPTSPEVVNNGTVITDNLVKDYSGIGIFGGIQTNITITNNTLSITGPALLGTSLEGIRNQATTGTTNITGNTISISTTSTTITGITGVVSNTGGTDNITKNYITRLAGPSSTQILGMLLTPLNGGVVNINNNFVSITDVNSAATLLSGLYFNVRAGASYTSNVYHNSIRIGGTANVSTNLTSFGVRRTDDNVASTFNFKNNLILTDRDKSVGFFNQTTTGVLSIDYNNYFGAGATSSFPAGWGTSFFTNAELAEYKTAAAPQEQNTTFSPITFVSNTDLHLAPPSSTDPTLKGTPIAGITTDIDNNTRSTTAPTKGADEPGGPVPVSLFVFSGASKGTFNQLTWSTASESNNAGFELQRSANGRDFNSIGFIRSKADNGTSSNTLSYSFDDFKPFATASYYRLKQLDRDGNFKYSGIVTLKGKGVMSVEITNLYPNPVKDVFSVVLGSAKSGTVSLIVTDATGKNVMYKNVPVSAGDNIIPVQGAALQSGVYMLRVVHQQTNETANIQFIK